MRYLIALMLVTSACATEPDAYTAPDADLCIEAVDRLTCLEAVPDGYRDGLILCDEGRAEPLPEGETDRGIGYRWGWIQAHYDAGC